MCVQDSVMTAVYCHSHQPQSHLIRTKSNNWIVKRKQADATLLFLLLQLLIVLLNIYGTLTQFCDWLGGYNLLAKG